MKMVSKEMTTPKKVEEPRNSAVVLHLKNNETVINADTSREQESPAIRRSARSRKQTLPRKSPTVSSSSAQGSVGSANESLDSSKPALRRSKRPRKEPKYLSPTPSPVASKKLNSSISMSLQSSETDDIEVTKKAQKKKATAKAANKVHKPTKASKSKGPSAKKGPKMTEYDRMIQKNIEERNAFLAKMMKGEGDAFEEGTVPSRSTAKKTRRCDSSTNDEEETEVPQLKKRRAVTRRKATSGDISKDEKPAVVYNTRSQGTERARGIYKEHNSSGDSTIDNTFSEAADISDEGRNHEAGAQRKTRSFKKTRIAQRVTKTMAMLVQKREKLKSKETMPNSGTSKEVAVDNQKSKEESGTNFNKNKDEENLHEIVESNKIILTPECNDEANDGEAPEEVIEKTADQITTYSTPLKANGIGGADTEVPRVRKLSDEFHEKNKENSRPEDKDQALATDVSSLND